MNRPFRPLVSRAALDAVAVAGTRAVSVAIAATALVALPVMDAVMVPFADFGPIAVAGPVPVGVTVPLADGTIIRLAAVFPLTGAGPVIFLPVPFAAGIGVTLPLLVWLASRLLGAVRFGLPPVDGSAVAVLSMQVSKRPPAIPVPVQQAV